MTNIFRKNGLNNYLYLLYKMTTKFIYKCSFFESKRHKISHTDMYYQKAEHTEWVLKSAAYLNGLAKVEYIMVAANSNEYKSAVENSHLSLCEEKQVQLMKEFERYGMKECVVCYENTDWRNIGIRCRTCKNGMCEKCCCEYSLANKFECKGDETGYGGEEYMPCPICRTINTHNF